MGLTRRSPETTLSFSLLGPPDVRLGDRPLGPLPSRKALALLVYLAVESSRSHDRKALALLLWPDAPPEKGLASLRQTLLALRRALGDERLSRPFLIADPRTVAFDTRTSHRLDLTLLESPPPDCRVLEDPGACRRCADQLMGAVESIRGPFLEGFDLPDCEEFEAWVEGVRERTRTQAARAIEQLVRIKTNAGDLPEAIRIATLGLRIDPFDEGGHRRLMRLFAASGNRRAAELQFESCRNSLVRELGVPPSPETMALLREITKGKSKEPVDLSPGPSECCPVTVLFCDAHSEPSEEHNSSQGLRSLQKGIPDFIAHRGGVWAASHGGAFIAWFGLGHFREGAARRAARTALELVELFRRETGTPVRIGLHTGMVTVEGRPVPDSSGATERVAMSLCLQGFPGDLLLSETTASLLASQFLLEKLPGHSPFPGAGAIHRLRGLSHILDSPEREEGPLHGRDQEISLFRKHWQAGRGGALLLEGPPGIGKSRLVKSFVSIANARLSPDLPPPIIRRLTCLPHFSDSPFFPVIQMLRELLGLSWDQEPSLSQARIQSYVQGLGLPHPQRETETLRDLLGLDSPSSPRARRVSLRQSVENLLLGILRIRKGPYLLVIEDLHWADESTRHVLRTALEDPELNRRILTVITLRTGERPPWIDHLPHLLPISLRPLTDDESHGMVRDLISQEKLSDTEIGELVRTSGGVPLFLTEGVRNLLDIRQRDHQSFHRSPPRNLDELLSERLARYPQYRPFYQRAAVIGRIIPERLFRLISPEPSEFIDGFFSQGIRAGLLRPLGNLSEPSFEFCHLLFQKAALSSLAPEERERLHLQVGKNLLASFASEANATPELLAYHFEQGGDLMLASAWFEKAGRRSFARGSFVEALNNTESALRLLRSLAPHNKDIEMDIGRLLLLRGKIRTEMTGLGKEVEGIFREASQTLGATRKISSHESLQAIFAQFQLLMAQARLNEAKALMDRLRKQGGAWNNPAIREMECFARGQFHYHRGEFREAILAFGDPDPQKEWPGSYLPGGFGRQISCYRALAYWVTGNYQRAREERELIEGWAREETPLRGFYLTFLCHLSCLFGDVVSVRRGAEEILDHAEKSGSEAWIPSGLALRGWALARSGESEGISLLLKSLPLSRKIHWIANPIYLSFLAEGYLAAGDGRRAKKAAEAALSLIHLTGVRSQESELWRLRGEGSRKDDDPKTAEESFKKAIKVAARQGATAFSLRGAVALSLFYCDQGAPEKVRPLLLSFKEFIMDPGADPSLPEVQTARELLSRAAPLKKGTNVRSFGSKPRPRRDAPQFCDRTEIK